MVAEEISLQENSDGSISDDSISDLYDNNAEAIRTDNVSAPGTNL